MPSILEQIESQYPVEQILVNGEQVWPYLRIQYHFALTTKRSESLDDVVEDPQISAAGKTAGRVMRLGKEIVCGLPCGLRNWFRRYDYIAFTDSGCRRQVGGKYTNPFLDPIIDEIGPNRVLCVETRTSSQRYGMRQVYTRHVVSRSLVLLSALVIMGVRRLLLRRYRVEGSRILAGMEADLELRMSAAEWIEFSEATRRVFTWLFRAMRPRGLLLTCYYGGKEGATKAARGLGIKVFEVQHGVIGKKHPAYNVYRDIDRSCFPDHLLVFGQREVATFDNARFIDRANVHPVGSYYLDYIKSNYRRERELSERISGYEKVVGVTLQWTMEKRLIGFVCEAAMLDSSILYILIPREPENPAYSAMELPGNVVVIRDRNFYELMTYCDFHSTVYSTCALEAPALGVQNILIDLDGSARSYYGEVLSDERITRFADSPKGFVELVKRFSTLERDVVCELHKGFFARNYQENIRDFVKAYLR